MVLRGAKSGGESLLASPQPACSCSRRKRRRTVGALSAEVRARARAPAARPRPKALASASPCTGAAAVCGGAPYSTPSSRSAARARRDGAHSPTSSRRSSATANAGRATRPPPSAPSTAAPRRRVLRSRAARRRRVKTTDRSWAHAERAYLKGVRRRSTPAATPRVEREGEASKALGGARSQARRHSRLPQGIARFSSCAPARWATASSSARGQVVLRRPPPTATPRRRSSSARQGARPRRRLPPQAVGGRVLLDVHAGAAATRGAAKVYWRQGPPRVRRCRPRAARRRRRRQPREAGGRPDGRRARRVGDGAAHDDAARLGQALRRVQGERRVALGRAARRDGERDDEETLGVEHSTAMVETRGE